MAFEDATNYPAERVPKKQETAARCFTQIAKAKRIRAPLTSSWHETTFVYFNLACGQGDRCFGGLGMGMGTGELAASLLQSDKSLLHLITVFVFAAVFLCPTMRSHQLKQRAFKYLYNQCYTANLSFMICCKCSFFGEKSNKFLKLFIVF